MLSDFKAAKIIPLSPQIANSLMENFNKPHTPIKEWAEDDRPREKMITLGAASLTPTELLAILINNGTKSKSAMDLAKELLVLNSNSLHKLGRMNLNDLQMVKGIGPAKAVVIKAALELAVKKEAELLIREKIMCSADVLNYFKKRLQNENREHFVVVYLNQGNRVISYETISSGGISGTVVDPRLIIRRALELYASSIIACHNHPSGNCQPSKADNVLTEKLQKAALFFDIRLLDHLIVSDEGHYSFADAGML
jgi:DNA repair protein RadC